MNSKGVTTMDLSEKIRERPGTALEWRNVTSYRSAARVMIELRLRPLGGDKRPWVPEAASLVSETGTALEVLSLWPVVPIPPEGDSQWVWVEAVAPPSGAGRFTLRFAEAGGTRELILDGITFP